MNIGDSVKRPSRPGQTFPLIKTFVFTDEDLNPWRCDNCLTKPQRAKLKPAVDGFPGEDQPQCCRKCGVDFI